MIPAARPGLVVRYEYLWRRQHLAGRTVAEKDRPACVVLSVSREDGERVVILPITTQPPPDREPAREIPQRVREHLGFPGGQRCWIVLSEANVDVLPSPDLRPLPGSPGRFAYGLLPLRMVTELRAAVLEAIRRRRLGLVPRDED